MTDQIPATATEARTVLQTRIADKAFADRVFAGDVAATKELHELSAMSAGGGDDVVALAMAGIPTHELSTADQRIMASTANMMRDLGFPPKAIQETLSDKEATAEDVERARVWKTQAFKNPEWVKRFMSGDGDAQREMMAANIVLSSHKTATAAS
jgi:hypothetical protein